MKVKDLGDKRILVKYGSPENPYQYAVDLLDFFKKKVYEPFYRGRYPFCETEFRYESNLSDRPYSKTDRCTMPDSYLCMGSFPAIFSAPITYGGGSVSPFAFVDFWHTEKKHNHHNTYVWWRNPDGSTKNCDSRDMEGHAKIDIERDVSVSLWIDETEAFKGTIPGRKKQ